ncbi:MAG TPA: TssQ family T6SS-associated lipoprotein [Noviherbaspirillum sp.]|jgi:tetratricopeptide (TPR) repeat protein|uniref:TssQ family T6SS-associated lipoprotein n=1 Tax=Noviherbaspirillum sp. TaxID=1926288 RepID=UPI002DDCEA07|nr:TssQ family T6SS-associated lipoprotein [Noviherbaspirillum sp.]HEV2609511.1 TssQ family T6SS-associated lipoprotein [Noviherbaspirillum sp.]
MSKLVPSLLALLLSACAQLGQQTADQSTISQAEAQSLYKRGITSYKESRYDAALTDLTAAIDSGRLGSADILDARKHVAFINCASSRELPCREQFQAILKADPKFELAANEASHPLWGPVWRSVKGASEEQRAVSRAGSTTATPAQNKLAEGIKEYDAGNYKNAVDALQSAIKMGLPEQADEIRARKYSAFTYCLTRKTTLCRSEFRKLFTLHPGFELLPSEAGHPSWANVYRSEKAAAQKTAKKTPKS